MFGWFWWGFGGVGGWRVGFPHGCRVVHRAVDNYRVDSPVHSHAPAKPATRHPHTPSTLTHMTDTPAGPRRVVNPDQLKFNGALTYNIDPDSDDEPDTVPDLRGLPRGTTLTLVVDIEITGVAENRKGDEVVTASVTGADRIEPGAEERAWSLCGTTIPDIPSDTDRAVIILPHM